MLKRLLVPLDGSPQAETALVPALALAKRFAGELLLVRTAWAHSFPGTDPGRAQLQAIEEAKAYLETIATRLRKDGIPVLTAVPYDTPAAGIADQATFRHADLIVMVAPARKGLAALRRPRIIWKVFTHTNAPLLIWKGPAAEGDRPRWLRELGEASALLPEAQDSLRLAEDALPKRSNEGLSQ